MLKELALVAALSIGLSNAAFAACMARNTPGGEIRVFVPASETATHAQLGYVEVASTSTPAERQALVAKLCEIAASDDQVLK